MESRDCTKSLQYFALESILIHLLKSELRNGRWPIYGIERLKDKMVSKSIEIIDFVSRCRKVDILKTMLSISSDLNSLLKENLTVLHYVSYLGRKDLVEDIICTGTDLNIKSAKGYTALHFASMKGQDIIVKILIKNGANLNVQNDHGDSALIFASLIPTNGCLYALIEARSDVNLQNNYGQTALQNACLFKETDKAKALIEAGADVNISNEENTLIFELLPMPTPFSESKVYIRETYTPKEFDPKVKDILELLIDAHADVTQKDKQGNTILHRAILLKDNVKLIEKIVGLGFDLNERNDNGETSLHFACMSNDRRTLWISKEAGADKNIKSNEGNTVLHYAASFGSNESVIELIESGIEIDTQNNSGRTSLHISLCCHNFEVFETLLINHASVSVKDKKGNDPLWYMNDEDSVFHVFKLQHYFKSYRDQYENTIFHIFIKHCPLFRAKPRQSINEKLWSLIRTKRILFSNYLQVQNKFGQTPLHIAASESPETLSLIFSTFESKLQGMLLSDEFGNTFLHTFLHTHFSSSSSRIEGWEISFIERLMENKYHNCSDKIKKDLLQSRNKVGNTPLHLVFRFTEDREKNGTHNYYLKFF